MADLEKHSRTAYLLAAIISGTATEAERDEVEVWRTASVENATLYNRVMCNTFLEDQSKRVTSVDIVRAYQAVLEKRRYNARKRFISKTLLIAASFLLPFTIGLVLILHEDKAVETVPVVVQQEIHPGEAKAELLLADGSRMLLEAGLKDSSLIQQGTCVKAGDKEITYERSARSEGLAYNTLKIPRGGEFKVVLSDGTVVYLNSESELKYPVQFEGDVRMVSLTGEAYFEVKKDARHPFVVNMSASSVVVLGTSFNVRAYKDEKKVTATLVEGKVRFNAEGKSVSLEPGEQAVSMNTGKISKQQVDVYQYIAWKDGYFVFRQQRLENVMQELSRWYDIDIFFANPGCKEISFTGNVKRYADFGKIIEMLEMTGGVEFQVKDRTIVVR